jgi:O-methyltransferase involved in polyketide biosynthesis
MSGNPHGLDLEHPSAGRVYDYLLGGTNNYAIDREFAERQLELMPDIRAAARTNRAFLGRAVRCAVQAGIRQFVDIGSGLPTQGNVHEVADEVEPGRTRVVYIDNEPVAHAHAQILLEDTADPARHRALAGDFFDGPALWERVLADSAIDPGQPLCLLTVSVLHFMPPDTHPERPLTYYRDQLVPGSLLVLSHGSIDPDDTEATATMRRIGDNYSAQSANRAGPRTREEIAEFFGDFELLEPGLVWSPQWRPDTPVTGNPAHSRILAGVGRKRDVKRP